MIKVQGIFFYGVYPFAKYDRVFLLCIFFSLLSSTVFAKQLKSTQLDSKEKKETQTKKITFFSQDPTRLFYSLVPPEPYISIFSLVGTSYTSDFRTYLYKDYSLGFLKNKDKEIKEEVVTYSTLDLQFALAYKYFLFKNLLQFQFGSKQFFDSKGFSIQSKESTKFQTLYIPEIHFVLNFISIGVGLPMGDDLAIKEIRLHPYNLYFPMFSLSSSLKIYKWPSFVNSSVQIHSASSFEDFIYSGSLGLQVDLTYYVTIAFSYKGLTKLSQKIRHNLVVLDFHYRILRNFSGAVSFIQSVYSEGKNPYNQFCFKIGYRKAFSPPEKFLLKEILEEKVSPKELQEVQKAIDSLLDTSPQ